LHESLLGNSKLYMCSCAYFNPKKPGRNTVKVLGGRLEMVEYVEYSDGKLRV